MRKTPIPDLAAAAPWIADPAGATMLFTLSNDRPVTITSILTRE